VEKTLELENSHPGKIRKALRMPVNKGFQAVLWVTFTVLKSEKEWLFVVVIG